MKNKIINKNKCILIFILIAILISSFLVISEGIESGSPNYLTPSKEVKGIDSGEKIGEEILINLEEITSGSNSYIKEPEASPNKPRKTQFQLYSENKVEIEGKIDGSFDINQIKKTETIKGKDKKEVRIWSEQHIEEEITAYTDIQEISENEKQKVRIYWVNENKEIPVKEFIDSNENGLYDRISWIIPHLSEQIFEITIDFSTESSSEEIQITGNFPEGTISNPISFDFNINYSSLENIDCSLTILTISPTSISNTTNFNVSTPHVTYQLNLTNGTYAWVIYCSDPINGTSNTTEGSFTIAEDFSVSDSKGVYLLDGEGNLIGGEGKIQIHSEQSSEISIKIHRPSPLEDLTIETSGTDYELTLDQTILESKGDYLVEVTFNRLSNPISISKTFSVARANLTIQNHNITTNEELIARVEISSPVDKISSIILDYGDNIIDSKYINDYDKVVDFVHTYSIAGNYILNLTIFFINGQTFEITKNGVTVEDARDTEIPSITLEYPSNDEIIRESKVDFLYSAEDNIKLENCTFELYNYSENFGALEYNITHEGADIGKEIKLQDFTEGDYTWYIGCYDSSSNYAEKSRDFTISLNESAASLTSSNNETENETPYGQKEELESLISQINDFLSREESSGLKEKEAIEDLGISTDLNFYKRRLNQIDKDLALNLKFVEDENLREKRRLELIDEIQSIKEKIPTNLEVVDEKEFVKNTLTEDMESIIEAYLESKNTEIDKNKIKKLSELNYKIQNNLVVSTSTRHVKIDYNTGTKEITLVTKKLDLKNNSFEIILESIPKSLAQNSSDVIFLTETKIIKDDPLFEISIPNIQNNKIIYYIESFVDFSEVEKTETILFKEFAIDSMKITGFSISDIDVGASIYYSIIISAIILIAYLLLIYSKKLNLRKWKKEENTVRVLEFIKEAKHALLLKDYPKAKENYHNTKQIYPLLQEGCKKHLYKDLKKIQAAIDKKDIFDLVKEFEESKIQGRKEDALAVYKNIQATYKRLPKKDQKIIYNKLVI